MLLDAPEKRIRLFVTDKNHELHFNTWANPEQSIAFHPHHCDVTLHCVQGVLHNIIVEKINPDFYADVFEAYRYKSSILNNQGSFEWFARVKLKQKCMNVLLPGDSEFMSARTIHTIRCFRDTVNAWFVYEGKKNPEYQPVCYSTKMEKQMNDSLTGLYEPMTIGQVYHYLKLAGL